jgi:hypothetical protein
MLASIEATMTFAVRKPRSTCAAACSVRTSRPVVIVIASENATCATTRA